MHHIIRDVGKFCWYFQWIVLVSTLKCVINKLWNDKSLKLFLFPHFYIMCHNYILYHSSTRSWYDTKNSWIKKISSFWHVIISNYELGNLLFLQHFNCSKNIFKLWNRVLTAISFTKYSAVTAVFWSWREKHLRSQRWNIIITVFELITKTNLEALIWSVM